MSDSILMWKPDAIGCHRMPSDAIGCHRMPAEHQVAQASQATCEAMGHEQAPTVLVNTATVAVPLKIHSFQFGLTMAQVSQR